MKIRVLFVCTENSSRSQMAEGFLRQQGGDSFEVLSGGADPTKLNPMAVEVMKEVGIDISGQVFKGRCSVSGQSFHYVIRVCDKVREKRPVLPGALWYLDWSFEDPARAEGSHAERLVVFQRVRDQIESRITEFLAQQSSVIPRTSATTARSGE
jgi:arsenate reductase